MQFLSKHSSLIKETAFKEWFLGREVNFKRALVFYLNYDCNLEKQNEVELFFDKELTEFLKTHLDK
jgi:hypothetical protein